MVFQEFIPESGNARAVWSGSWLRARSKITWSILFLEWLKNSLSSPLAQRRIVHVIFERALTVRFHAGFADLY
jgi:hypothetical protein